MNRKARRRRAKPENIKFGSTTVDAASSTQRLDAALRSSKSTAELALMGFRDEVVRKGTPATIFHYTDYNGLRGILENREIWLSSIFRMNDPSELRHGIEPIIDLVNQFASSRGPIVKQFAKFFSQVLRGNIEQTGIYLIASFSKNDDELGQWRAYADDGRGYAIGFDTKELEAPLKEMQVDGIATASFLVEYSDEILTARQKEIFDAFAPALRALEDGQFSLAEVEMHAKEISVELSLAALQVSTFHKHSGYRSEEEYRFIFLNSRGQIENQLKHRIRRDQIVPYLPYSWRDIDPNPLKQIRFGPSGNPKSCSAYIQDCLKLSKFMDGVIGVSQSKIPYRSKFDL